MEREDGERRWRKRGEYIEINIERGEIGRAGTKRIEGGGGESCRERLS